MIKSIKQLDPNGNYTYGDYLLWKFEERVELLKGKLFPMAAPNRTHQEISTVIQGQLWYFLRTSNCKLYSAPFDVRLPLPTSKVKGEKVDTVVQPDLCVVCDKNKLDSQGCNGAPDLIVEILSPENSKREMKNKFELYEKVGVLEYWIIDPVHYFVHVYHLNSDTQKFVALSPSLTSEDILKSSVLEGFELNLQEVFPKEENTDN